MMTGGGPPPPNPSAEDLAIIQALPNEFIIDNNKFDSDGIYMDTIKQSQKSENLSATINCNKLEPGGSKEVIEVLGESVQAKPEAGNVMETPVSKNKPLKRFRQIKMHTQSKNNAEDYEQQQLFLLAKNSKEREFERAEEINKKRLLIMALEEEYWRKKINSI